MRWVRYAGWALWLAAVPAWVRGQSVGADGPLFYVAAVFGLVGAPMLIGLWAWGQRDAEREQQAARDELRAYFARSPRMTREEARAAARARRLRDRPSTAPAARSGRQRPH